MTGRIAKQFPKEATIVFLMASCLVILLCISMIDWRLATGWKVLPVLNCFLMLFAAMFIIHDLSVEIGKGNPDIVYRYAVRSRTERG